MAISAMMSVSVDGCFEAPGHDLGWQSIDEELHQHFNDWLRDAGAFLDGRVTYELMASFWPTADTDPGAAKPVREFAGIWRDMPKVVYSRSLDRADWNTQVRREVDVDEVRNLAQQSRGDLVVGGGNLLATFMRLDLLDELRLYVHPVILGTGTPLFAAAQAPVPLRLIDTRRFDSGVVLLHYARRDSAAP
ncbi:MAG TPA: dihydrofolate reductase family protein [Humibacter sp.]|nr:dihydrofolate reductase family protein [Humibacter sp.]